MKLLTMDTSQIEEFVEQLENECSDSRKHALELTWAMRGGVQYNDVLNMSANERKFIASLSKDNLETTKRSGLPYF